MTIAINLPVRTGGSAPQVIIPTSTGGGAIDLEFPRNAGPQGPPGTRSTDIGFSLKGSVPPTIGSIPVTEQTVISASESLAQATGTGTVVFDLSGSPVGSVAFPGAVFTITNPTLARGFLNFTSTGSLSDLSLALAGER